MSARATPIGGKIMTSTMKALLIMAAIGGALVLVRYLTGLGVGFSFIPSRS